MTRKNLVLILYMVIIGVFSFVCIDAVEFFHYGARNKQQESLMEINEGWRFKEKDTVHKVEHLPKVFLDTTSQGTLIRKLPEALNGDSILAFRNRFQDVQVKIDGEERYSYTGLLPNSYRRMNTNVFCIIDLEKEDSGKTIEVFFHAPLANSSLYLPDFFIGTEPALLLNFFRYDAPALIFSGIMIFFALLFLAMCIRQKAGGQEKCGVLAHTSILMALSGIWSITNSSMVYLSVQNDMVLAFLSFNSFMLLPVAIPIFYGDVLEEQKGSLNRLAGVASLNFVLQNLLYFFGKYQYIEMMPITYIVSLLSIFVLIGISFQERAKGASYYASGFLISTIIFLGFYILDVLRFFYDVPMDNARFFRYGILAFIIIILWICAKRMLCYVEVEVENRVYKELALRDVLTRLPNRAALEKRIQTLEEVGRVCGSLTVILMDVNGLKPVNDKNGHGAGDRLLCEAAKSIKDAFPEEQDAWYRLGGDEFVVLLTETALDNEECQERILRATEKWENYEHGPISISCGSKSVRNLKITRDAVLHLMHEADQIMYKNKIQYYQKKLNKRSSHETV
ncbi:sensor domain-containing diguanylate cyclase [Anaerotignum sp. MB30-C6]|uniref:sensor domain-containing diguanylate cyclase n=1 Tax=Anaerotignum sp. MB30-C6 TaxID=3070814 RepID=UPI0027DC502F|nr:diguanylate cyclase [Anaerotignum sp. MB30-C6]WMI80727.1 diguanylate cyclase [Anaerotignum sp. MB30-C6]